MNDFPRGAGWTALACLFLLLGLALSVQLSCSGDASGVATPCTDDDVCGEGRCVEGFCTDTPPRASSTSSAPVLGTSSTSGSRDTSIDISTSSRSGLGEYLDPCNRGDECRSGICISSPQGRVCTRFCAFDEECEPAAGWRCQFVQGDRDLVQICYPDPADLCEACTVDTDCGGLNDRCVGLENGTFCGLDCRTGSRCPEGYLCIENSAEDWTQCVPAENRCGDCRFADTNTDPFHCGECDRVCEFERGLADCVNGTCVLAACEIGWDNCDDDEATGCETDLLNDPANCGSCGNACPEGEGTPICVEGVCDLSPCASGEVFCEGDCRAPNACGGCAALDETPDTSCGACDTGTWRCVEGDRERVTCEGATDPLTDSVNCGAACETCTEGV